jgi:hypothetical protein
VSRRQVGAMWRGTRVQGCWKASWLATFAVMAVAHICLFVFRAKLALEKDRERGFATLGSVTGTG